MTDQGLTIVHVIDSLAPGNHGIIEAALSTARALQSDFGIHSELWFPEEAKGSHEFDLRGAELVAVARGRDLEELAREHLLAPNYTVVVTHGCWRWPTVIGAKFKKAGYSWVYVPHGMLEPWSLRQKRFKKWAYWHLRESRLSMDADVIRATSLPERENLERMYQNVSLISHGIARGVEPQKSMEVINVLFMGRLHPKKGASKLAEAWKKSDLQDNEKFRLIIVGSDGDDLDSLAKILKGKPSNMELRKPVYGTGKEELLNECQFFALPSYSEGLPMALLEGMSAGLVPIISEGCNLPGAMERGFAIRVSPEVDSIVAGLNEVATMEKHELQERGKQARLYIEEEFSLRSIARQQADLYRSLVS